MLRFVVREMVRNARRTMVAMLGAVLSVGLLSGILFFSDASGATMTRRAVSSLTIDAQAVLESSLGRRLRFEETVSAPEPLRPGDGATFVLRIFNTTTSAVHEVVVNDETPPPFVYVPDTTSLDGSAVAEPAVGSPLAQGLARSGLNIGAIGPGQLRTLTFRARAGRFESSLSAIAVRGLVSSREEVVPVPANAPGPLTVAQIRRRIADLDGVAGADSLSFVDLPANALRVGDLTIDAPVRLFAFDAMYRRHHPEIRVTDGALAAYGVVLSAEATRVLRTRVGGTVEVRLPGKDVGLLLPLAGIADLSQAEALFSSRKVTKLDDFLYMPFSAVVSPAVFEAEVVPAYRTASARPGAILRSVPLSEVDVGITRRMLHRQPADALLQTQAIADAIRKIAPESIALIDNISNTLEVARDDAAVGRRMFVFLGFPGLLLGAFIALYAANLHAEAQRRENATLRQHGADRVLLAKVMAFRTVVIAGTGAVLGIVTGLAGVIVVLGRDSLFATPKADLGGSAAKAAVIGGGSILASLYLQFRRSMQRDVASERAELAVCDPPRWLRHRYDIAFVAGAAIAAVLNSRISPPAQASVSQGIAASLPTRQMIAPLAWWLGGALLVVRAMLGWTRRLPTPDQNHPSRVLRGTFVRDIRRRPTPIGTATAGTTLVVAFAVSLATMGASHDVAKRTDARFAVGSDVRITPGVSDNAAAHDDSAAFVLGGVQAATPVSSRLDNAVLIGPYNQDRADLAAIDPTGFGAVAALSNSGFSGMTAASAMAALARSPDGLFLLKSRAEDLSIEVGDHVQVLLARGTKHQKLLLFSVLGLFNTLPGFPHGIDLIVNRSTYRTATGLNGVDFYLARVRDTSRTGLAATSRALHTTAAMRTPLAIATSATTQNKDQSSLTAVNIHGLLDLGRALALAMAVSTLGIFVLGLLMQRRREYMTLRAIGVPMTRLFLMIAAQAGYVAVWSLVGGTVIGLTMARLLVTVLHPLFILTPRLVVPVGPTAFLAAAVITSVIVSAATAALMLRRLAPTAILREP